MAWKPISVLYKYEGGARDAYMSTHHLVTTLATTSSWPDSKTLVAYEVLAHPRVAFHPCMCRLCEDATTVAAPLIGYDDLGLLPR
jgi:hypothetical protein